MTPEELHSRIMGWPLDEIRSLQLELNCTRGRIPRVTTPEQEFHHQGTLRSLRHLSAGGSGLWDLTFVEPQSSVIPDERTVICYGDDDFIDVHSRGMSVIIPNKDSRDAWATWSRQRAVMGTRFKLLQDKPTYRQKAGDLVRVVGYCLHNGGPMVAPQLTGNPYFTQGLVDPTHQWLADCDANAWGAWAVSGQILHPIMVLQPHDNPRAAPVDTRWPHWCRCGSPAYCGYTTFECRAGCSSPAAR